MVSLIIEILQLRMEEEIFPFYVDQCSEIIPPKAGNLLEKYPLSKKYHDLSLKLKGWQFHGLLSKRELLKPCQNSTETDNTYKKRKNRK